MARTQEKRTLFENQYGQVQCHKCGCYSDLIYPVHLRSQNGSWVSMFCHHCYTNTSPSPENEVIQVDDPIDLKTYEGPVKEG